MRSASGNRWCGSQFHFGESLFVVATSGEVSFFTVRKILERESSKGSRVRLCLRRPIPICSWVKCLSRKGKARVKQLNSNIWERFRALQDSLGFVGP